MRTLIKQWISKMRGRDSFSKYLKTSNDKDAQIQRMNLMPRCQNEVSRMPWGTQRMRSSIVAIVKNTQTMIALLP